MFPSQGPTRFALVLWTTHEESLLDAIFICLSTLGRPEDLFCCGCHILLKIVPPSARRKAAIYQQKHRYCNNIWTKFLLDENGRCIINWFPRHTCVSLTARST